MNNFNRNQGFRKSGNYQPAMKKRGVNNLEEIEDSKQVSEDTQSVLSQDSQSSCPSKPQQSPSQPPYRPGQPPQQSPSQPPHRPGQPPYRPGQPPQQSPSQPPHRPGQSPYHPNQRPSNRPPQPPKSSDDRLDNLVNTASKHLNTSPEELRNAAQSGNMQKLFSQMSPSQAQQLQKILSDENAAKKLLSTPQAQALLRGLSKNE